MPPFSHLAPKYKSNTQVFLSTSFVAQQGYQVWQKPRGCSMVHMVCWGGGGGGGAGFTRNPGNAGGGGGSGASSGVTRFTCAATLLPDTLYIIAGNGGLGGRPGVSSGNGTNGLNSFVLTAKTNVLPNIVLYSGVNQPGGGGGGTGAAAGAAGSVPTIAVVQPTAMWGEWFATVGLVGVIGGAQTGAVGTDITAWAANCLTPGASGAGCTAGDFAGGNITATALLDLGSNGYYPTGTGNVAKAGTAAGAGVDGSAGRLSLTPFYNSGGAGGGSNNSGQAGHGGAGGYGCGGGGGGAGQTAGNGGNGGAGGVIITSW